MYIGGIGYNSKFAIQIDDVKIKVETLDNILFDRNKNHRWFTIRCITEKNQLIADIASNKLTCITIIVALPVPTTFSSPYIPLITYAVDWNRHNKIASSFCILQSLLIFSFCVICTDFDVNVSYIVDVDRNEVIKPVVNNGEIPAE